VAVNTTVNTTVHNRKHLNNKMDFCSKIGEHWLPFSDVQFTNCKPYDWSYSWLKWHIYISLNTYWQNMWSYIAFAETLWYF